MNNRDFDKVIDRRNTESYKWYGDNHGLDDGQVIPMWVADMDFRCAQPIIDAVVKRAEPWNIWISNEKQGPYSVHNFMAEKTLWM